MKTLNYGIISSASIVPRFVAALKESKHSKAVAIGASKLSKAQKVADELGIKKAYGSYKEVYEDPEVDVVYIATINDQQMISIFRRLWKLYLIKSMSFVKNQWCFKQSMLRRLLLMLKNKDYF